MENVGLAALTLVSLVSLSSAAVSASTSTGEIRAVVMGARSDDGTVRCGLFASAAEFPKAPAAKVSASIRGGQAECAFPARPAGRYAVAAFHDENGNEKLDTNLLGAPKEGLAFSNDVRPKLGPPKFDAIAFSHDGTISRLTIHLRY